MLLSLSVCVVIGFWAIANALSTKPDISMLIDSHPKNSTQASMLGPRSQIKCNAPSNPLQIQFEKYGTQLEDFKKYPGADAEKACGAICISDDTVNNPINVHRKELKHKENIDKPEREDPSKYHRRLYCEAEKPSSRTRFNYKACKDTIARIDDSCGGYGGEVTESGVTYRVYAVGISNGWSSSQNPGKGHKRSSISLNQTTAITHNTTKDVETSLLLPRVDRNLGVRTCNDIFTVLSDLPAPPAKYASGIQGISNYYKEYALKACTEMCLRTTEPRPQYGDKPWHWDFHVGPRGRRGHKRIFCSAKYATPMTAPWFDRNACAIYFKDLIDECGTFGGRLIGDRTEDIHDNLIQGNAMIQYDIWAVFLDK